MSVAFANKKSPRIRMLGPLTCHLTYYMPPFGGCQIGHAYHETLFVLRKAQKWHIKKAGVLTKRNHLDTLHIFFSADYNVNKEQVTDRLPSGRYF